MGALLQKSVIHYLAFVYILPLSKLHTHKMPFVSAECVGQNLPFRHTLNRFKP